MRKSRRTKSITLAATLTASLALTACDYNQPDGARYGTYQECVLEFGDEYCEDGRDGFYYSHFYYAGGHVYGYNKASRKYQVLPRSSGVYGNPGLAPARALSTRTGGFGTTARGVSVGG